jgi:hypothetical protein
MNDGEVRLIATSGGGRVRFNIVERLRMFLA